MNDQPTPNDPLSPQKPSLSADALLRRRLLLKGATGSAAALAALQPVGALATGTSTVLYCKNADNKDVLCSLSGVTSAAHTFGPNVAKVLAVGKNKNYWYAKSNWPTGCTPLTYVKDLLPGASSGVANMTLRDLLNPAAVNSANFGTAEADFVCAYLNGLYLYGTLGPTDAMTFPYSAAKVKEFWGTAPSATRTSARNLFVAIQTAAS